MANRLCILHWMPVEDFPPAMNLARYFAESEQWEVSLCTNKSHLDRKKFTHDLVNLVQGIFPTGRSGVRRVFAYFSFHVKSFFHLLKTRPDIILYIEPHSAFPVFLSQLFLRRARLFIHYHEYHAPGDFDKPGMRMARWSQRVENLWLFTKAKWVSQTNESRLVLFLADHPEINPSIASVLPNYPPHQWWSARNRAWAGEQTTHEAIRLVYVGALSMVDTYLEEIVAFIKSQRTEDITLEIYSYNLHEETRDYLRKAVDEQIRFHEEGVDYDALPNLLRDFHAGLILYKGNTLNYVHNATNKLFEYLACGLDVIYPKPMEGVKPYASLTSRPRVIECDFEDMEGFSYDLQGRQQLPSTDAKYYCDSELERLEKAMLDSI